jgi:hypothetical protein
VVVAVHRFLGALWSAHRDTTATIRSVD